MNDNLLDQIAALQRYVNKMGEERQGEFDEAALDAMLCVKEALHAIAEALDRIQRTTGEEP